MSCTAEQVTKEGDEKENVGERVYGRIEEENEKKKRGR